MLRALLDDLAEISPINVTVMLDWRCRTIADSYAFKIHSINDTLDVERQFQELLPWADAVWLIAPEFDGILEKFSIRVEQAGKRLLNSSSTAVALCADKWRTFETFNAARIPTVSTERLLEAGLYRPGSRVIKPVDGVGCTNTWRIDNESDLSDTLRLIDNPQSYLIQPYVEGANQSLSAIFYQGQGWLLCVNRQILNLNKRQFKLSACEVNAFPINFAYQQLMTAIAKAIPGLYGYVGIDLIVTADEIFVLEINPRLTSSYVGINKALGINCAELILQLSQQEPELGSRYNQCIRVALD